MDQSPNNFQILKTGPFLMRLRLRKDLKLTKDSLNILETTPETVNWMRNILELVTSECASGTVEYLNKQKGLVLHSILCVKHDLISLLHLT